MKSLYDTTWSWGSFCEVLCFESSVHEHGFENICKMAVSHLVSTSIFLTHCGLVMKPYCGRSGPALVQVVACCLMPPSNYLYQRWPIISEVLWHSSESNSTVSVILYNESEDGTSELTHWGWVTHIWVSKLTIIGLDNGLLPGWCQAIIWTNAGIWLIEPLETEFNGILINSYIFIKEDIFENVIWEMAAILCGPHCVNPWHAGSELSRLN